MICHNAMLKSRTTHVFVTIVSEIDWTILLFIQLLFQPWCEFHLRICRNVAIVMSPCMTRGLRCDLVFFFCNNDTFNSNILLNSRRTFQVVELPFCFFAIAHCSLPWIEWTQERFRPDPNEEGAQCGYWSANNAYVELDSRPDGSFWAVPRDICRLCENIERVQTANRGYGGTDID